MPILRPLLVLTLSLACLLATAGQAAAANPPRSFYGVQAWLTPSAEDFARMGRGKVGAYRVNLTWAAVEPSQGAPYSWSEYDRLIGNAARNGITVLPSVLGSPGWAARRTQFPPRSGAARAAYFRFLSAAVARYGRNGTFWTPATRASVGYRPITNWQVWNEPNVRVYWADRPNAGSYVRFLRSGYSAIKSRDSRARVVLAGLPETNRGISAPRYLRSIYRTRNSKRYFDVVAVHAYARNDRGALGAVIRARRLMNRYRDGRTPIYVTEVGWATGGRVDRRTSAFKASESGQSQRLRKTFKAFIKYRNRYKIRLVSWFSWRDRVPAASEPNWWAIHTGLIRRDGSSKPAWSTYKRFTGGH